MKKQTPFNLKTIITGVFFATLLVVMDNYSYHVVRGSCLAIDHMSAGAIFLFFLAVFLLNPLLRRLSGGRFLFSPPELLVVYIMLMVAASVSTMGLGSQLLPILATPSYYATPENRWAELILPHIRPWIAPTDLAVTRPFFEGLSRGETIPWGAWALPLAAWGAFLMVLYYVTICAVSILRKEWVEKERLPFPLVQLPLAMVQESGDGGKIPRLFRSRLFWLGFAIPFALSALTALSRYVPGFDAPRLNQWFPIFRQTTRIYVRLSFPVLGFAYLINKDIAFSLWFFNLLYLVLKGWFNITGIASPENVGIYGGGNPIFGALGTGAFIAYFAFSLYLARAHLKEVFLKATGRGEAVDDSGEIMPYRRAFWGLVVGFVFLLGWLIAAGMPPWVALVFLCLAFVFWLMLTRIIAESGVPTLISSSISSTQVVSSFGSQAVGDPGMVNFGLSYIYHSDIRTFPASSTMHAQKIAEATPAPSLRPLTWLMLGAILIGFLVSSFMLLHLGYTRGGLNLSGWFFIRGPQAPFTYVADYLRNPSGPNLLSWFNRTLGGGLMFFLLIMRNRFLWWPLHPIGMTIGMVTWMDELWFTIFLAWLIKSALLRYGGPRFYEDGKPLFFGFVLGQYSAAGTWFIIDLFTGMTGNSVFWI